MGFYWFHAFSRPDTVRVLEVLRHGPQPPPAGLRVSSTANEEILGLRPSVYAYLGRTLECFGDTAVALEEMAATGELSPFDTGGLVHKIEPIKGWEGEQRREYLRAFSWPAAEYQSALEVYPASDPDAVARYLACVRPVQEGPHELWAERPVAAIWRDPNHDWRAWTWECRSTTAIGDTASLYRWSCSAPQYESILRVAYVAAATDQSWFATLIGSFVEGGVSALVRDLRSVQGATT